MCDVLPPDRGAVSDNAGASDFIAIIAQPPPVVAFTNG